MQATERRTTQVELLWDLVFAFAVTRVTTLLNADLTWAGFGRAMLALALVWWAWSAFAWAANAEDPDAPVLRAVLLLATLLIFVSGLALPRAFGDEAKLFAATYAGVRFLHLGLYADASRRGHASLAAIAGFATTVVIGMGLLVGGAFASGALRYVLWIAAAAIDYAGPAWLTRERLRGLQEVSVAHFAERYGLFVIICLGESIVAIGIGASGGRLTASTVVGVSLALLTTIGLWWIYFDRFAAVAEERLRGHRDPVLAAADAYSYIHLVIVAGIIVFAVGAKYATGHIDDTLAIAPRLALCGGVAAYLFGHAAFRLRMTGAVSYAEVAAVGGCAAVFFVTSASAGWVTQAALCAVLVLLVAWQSAFEDGARFPSRVRAS